MSGPDEAPGARRAFWRSFAVFEGLAPPHLDRLAAASSPRTWPKGAVLFQRGDPGDWLLALETGQVRLSVATAGGRELVLRHAGPGDTLGELALFDGAPRSADATALTAIRGRVLTRAAWAQLIAEDPGLTEGALAWVCARLRETTDQLESIALLDLQARAARFVLLTLRQLHGEEIPPDSLLRFDLSQSEIAAVLGASRPKVNRALTALAEAGALVREGAGLRCDLALLTRIAAGEDEG